MSMIGRDGEDTVNNKLNEIAEALERIENTLSAMANKEEE